MKFRWLPRHTREFTKGDLKETEGIQTRFDMKIDTNRNKRGEKKFNHIKREDQWDPKKNNPFFVGWGGMCKITFLFFSFWGGVELETLNIWMGFNAENNSVICGGGSVFCRIPAMNSARFF